VIQQVATAAIAVCLVAAIALSYFRTRGDSNDGSCDRMNATLDDFAEYFGVRGGAKRGRVSKALDLAPFEMLSDQLAMRGPKRRGERRSQQR
jgi:hypothetical protein